MADGVEGFGGVYGYELYKLIGGKERGGMVKVGNDDRSVGGLLQISFLMHTSAK